MDTDQLKYTSSTDVFFQTLSVTRIKIKLIILILISTVFINSYATKPSADSSGIHNTPIVNHDIKDGFYIVIGVFTNYENVLNHTKELKSKGYNCQFVYSDLKNRYYTFLNYSDSFKVIKGQYDNLKKESSFKDAWILNVKNINGKEAIEDHIKKEDTESPEVASNSHAGHHNFLNHHRDLSKTHNSYKIIVNTHNSNNEPIAAPIEIINGEAAKLIANIHSNNEEVIMCPKAYSQHVQLVCAIFGFHKTTFDINLVDPVNEYTMKNIKIEGDKIIVDLPLLDCQKGDIMVMYNVFFFPNTNIIRQRSNFELQRLLAMFKENPKLKITIHGHTNGNSMGPITKIADNYDNVFNPSETEGIKGSSRKLSELRAETIKMFLVRNGIAEDRLDIKGWGGKKMLYKEDSPLFEYNVRVEIEVIES